MEVKNIKDFLNFKDQKIDKKQNKSDINFKDVLKTNLKEVNRLQLESDELKKKLAIGELDNLHDLSIMSEKANIALQITMSIRTKIVEAYKEIMRIQI